MTASSAADRVPAAIKNWVTGRPWLFEAAFRALGKAYIEVSTLRRIVRHGDIVIDVGAAIGTYTSLLARLAGPQGMVHAFEPVPTTFLRLVTNVTANGLADRVQFNQVAIGEAEGTVDMHLPNGDFSQASMVPHRLGSWVRTQARVESYRCPVTTLDAYVATHRCSEVAFLKCDVEGAELPVLRGGLSLLRGPFPPILMFEAFAAWTADFDYTPADLLAFLHNEAGYEIYFCGRRSLSHVDQAVGEVPGEFPDFLNFLAVVPEVHRARIGSVLSP